MKFNFLLKNKQQSLLGQRFESTENKKQQLNLFSN